MADPKILIIGAGASGIAAACRLIQKGLKNVIILEAKDRIGGRINTVNFADNVVDLGAQWVHGEEGNVVFQLANSHDLLDSDYDGGLSKNLFANVQGNIIPPEEGEQAMNIYYQISGSETEELKEWSGTYGDFVKNKFYKQFQENQFTGNQRAPQFLDWIEKYDNHMQCSDSLFDVSARRMVDFRNCEGNPGLNWKTKGFKTVLDLLMKSYPSDEKKLPVMDNIIFNKEVSNINYSSNDQVVVTTSDGGRFDVSHVIFTPSLGVLKNEYRTIFTPSLPKVKERAIEGFSIGAVNKFFLEFSHRWWPEETNGLSFLWSKEEKEKFLSEYGHDNLWLCDVFIFFVVENHQSVLCGWSFGESARFTETLTDAEVSEGLNILLQKFYGKTYDIPKPVNFTRSKWFTDKHIRGGYSFRSMQTEKMDVKSEDLADPITTDICKPLILFAGEATHKFFYSTVHGAIETGFREAERLLDYYRTHVWLKPTRRCRHTTTGKILEPRECLSEITRIAIVGAGIAGLGAAKTLEKEGFDDYILIEATDRVGGRIHTIDWDENRIEDGAQFLHGDKSNLGQFCHHLSLLSDDHSGEAEGVYVRDDGLKIESHFILEVDDFVRYTLEECEQFANDNQILHPEMNQNIGKILRTRFNKYLSARNESERVRNILEELFDWNIKFLNIDNSCLSVDELSAKGWGKFKFVGGQEHTIFKSGYSSVTKAIADSLNQTNLRLNSPVKKIEWRDRISEDQDLTPVVLTLTDNRRIFADCVIVTSSLGFLKENHEEIFHPLLPHHLRLGIESLGFGLINKIFLKFDQVWWKPGTKGFQFIWGKKMKSNINSNFKLASWTKYLTGFDILEEEKNGVLLGWIGGRGAHIVETLSEQQVAQDCLKLLQVFLRRNDIPFPRKCLRTRWYNNKFVRGAYSHITSKCDKNGISPGNLGSPVWGFYPAENGMKRVPIMMLAGEATHEHFYSTTHGAYDTGVKQAKVFLRYHVQKESYCQSFQ